MLNVLSHELDMMSYNIKCDPCITNVNFLMNNIYNSLNNGFRKHFYSIKKEILGMSLRSNSSGKGVR